MTWTNCPQCGDVFRGTVDDIEIGGYWWVCARYHRTWVSK